MDELVIFLSFWMASKKVLLSLDILVAFFPFLFPLADGFFCPSTGIKLLAVGHIGRRGRGRR